MDYEMARTESHFLAFSARDFPFVTLANQQDCVIDYLMSFCAALGIVSNEVV